MQRKRAGSLRRLKFTLGSFGLQALYLFISDIAIFYLNMTTSAFFGHQDKEMSKFTSEESFLRFKSLPKSKVADLKNKLAEKCHDFCDRIQERHPKFNYDFKIYSKEELNRKGSAKKLAELKKGIQNQISNIDIQWGVHSSKNGV